MQDSQLTKPKIVEEKIGNKTVETWYLGQGNIIHDSVGCPHYFIQVSGNQVECNKCGLGLFGHAEKGILKS